MSRILVITNKYPNIYEPNVLVFVQQLIWEFADQKNEIVVICPSPVNIRPKLLRLPYYYEENTDTGSIISIYRPHYMGFGQSKILGFNPARVTTRCFTKAIEKTIIKNKILFDVIYSHFITPAGIAAARLGAKFSVPAFMAHGEATTMTIDHFGKERAAKELEKLSGIIAVSTDNKIMLQTYLGLSNVKIEVFPNAVRRSRFHPKDKNQSRDMFNLPKDKFIVSFVGSFDKRKGIKRLEEAVERSNDVFFIAAGSGELPPQSEKCLYSGQVPNEKLPFFYSSSDVFVLPTLNEGSCNAIIEAIACGLPIISSNRSYNDDILQSDYSIRINPESIDEIDKAIQRLKEDYGLINDFSMACQKYADKYDIKNRASNIINFMELRR